MAFLGVNNQDKLDVQGLMREALGTDPVAFILLRDEISLPAFETRFYKVDKRNCSVGTVASEYVSSVQ